MRRLYLLLGAGVALLAAVSLLVGPAGLGLPLARPAALILAEIRVPRTLLAALTGAALALAGAALQGYLRNPLAEPGIIGISSGAGLGAVLAIHTGASATFALALPLGGLAGAAIATVAVLALAGERGGALTLILAGVAVSSVATALISLALSLSSNPFAAVEIMFWLLGLACRSQHDARVAGGAADAGRHGRSAPARIAARRADAWRGRRAESRRRSGAPAPAPRRGHGTGRRRGDGDRRHDRIRRPRRAARAAARSSGHAPSRLLPASLLGGAALVLASDIVLRLLYARRANCASACSPR